MCQDGKMLGLSIVVHYTKSNQYFILWYYIYFLPLNIYILCKRQHVHLSLPLFLSSFFLSFLLFLLSFISSLFLLNCFFFFWSFSMYFLTFDTIIQYNVARQWRIKARKQFNTNVRIQNTQELLHNVVCVHSSIKKTKKKVIVLF